MPSACIETVAPEASVALIAPPFTPVTEIASPSGSLSFDSTLPRITSPSAPPKASATATGAAFGSETPSMVMTTVAVSVLLPLLTV